MRFTEPGILSDLLLDELGSLVANPQYTILFTWYDPGSTSEYVKFQIRKIVLRKNFFLWVTFFCHEISTLSQKTKNQFFRIKFQTDSIDQPLKFSPSLTIGDRRSQRLSKCKIFI